MSHIKNRVDLAIETLIKKENPTIADLNAVVAAGQIEDGKKKYLVYRVDGRKLTQEKLQQKNGNSTILTKFIESIRGPKSHSLTDAHVIEAGTHQPYTGF